MAHNHHHLFSYLASNLTRRQRIQRIARETGLAYRMRFASGDFYAANLPTRQWDQGHILHDWDLETKRFFCVKAYDAAQVGARRGFESDLDDGKPTRKPFGLLMRLTCPSRQPGG